MARVVAVLALALLAAAGIGAAVLSYDAPCAAVPAPSPSDDTMQAVTSRCYGPPDTLRMEAVAKPVPAADEVLVRVHAAAANPLDWHYMRGKPYVMRLAGAGIGRPAFPVAGVDFAGTVEAVGADVTRFRTGDRVFGGRSGAFAEYLVVRESRAVAHIPAGIEFEQAAALPIAAVTALQALRDTGALVPGQKVLVNGASGGVGTYAVQIAGALGAEVTGVCSTRNVELVRLLGAARVIDYTREDFTLGEARYDLVIDNVGNRSLLDIRRVMAPTGVYMMIGGPKEGEWLGPLVGAIKGPLLSLFTEQEFGMFLAELTQADLEALARMLADGTLESVIDRRYPMTEAPAAIAYLEEGHARGKVVLHW